MEVRSVATAKTWKSRIRKVTRDAGTYRPYFEPIIGELADILERKDTAKAAYLESGGQPIIEHTNIGGASYLEKNPCLKIIEESEKLALPYWRDLGLTPAGLKKIREEAMKSDGTAETVSFASLLESLTG